LTVYSVKITAQKQQAKPEIQNFDRHRSKFRSKLRNFDRKSVKIDEILTEASVKIRSKSRILTPMSVKILNSDRRTQILTEFRSNFGQNFADSYFAKTIAILTNCVQIFTTMLNPFIKPVLIAETKFI